MPLSNTMKLLLTPGNLTTLDDVWPGALLSHVEGVHDGLRGDGLAELASALEVPIRWWYSAA